ncbi:hypothetical protein, partial [Spongiibacter sp.]|uniref:hypothetical protein n=1 Tax=Spongiibacter sp. TaxID=2024860 RepID=UPI0025809E95
MEIDQIEAPLQPRFSSTTLAVIAIPQQITMQLVTLLHISKFFQEQLAKLVCHALLMQPRATPVSNSTQGVFNTHSQLPTFHHQRP